MTRARPGRELTYHGSAARRAVLRHGGQAGRWRVLALRVTAIPARNARRGRRP